MAAPNPAQQLTNEIQSLQSKLSSLQQSIRLTDLRDAIEDLQVKISSSPQRIAGLRRKGFVFDKNLEEQARNLSDQWRKVFPALNHQVTVQSSSLQSSIIPIETQMKQLSSLSRNPVGARPIVTSLQTHIKILEDKVSAAEKTIRGMFDQTETQLNILSRKLDSIDYLLTNLAEASFQQLSSEGGIAAVKAVWCKSAKEQKEDPEGILFLTDQRILFEQKEQVATKKVLFIATEKQKVQNLLWEIPLALVDQISTSKQGMLKNEDHIEIRFQTGGTIPVAHLHIWENCELWQALINRAKGKEFDKDRIIAVDQAIVDKVKAAPTQCPSCGAILNAVVLRGQENLKCEYCGALIRL